LSSSVKDEHQVCHLERQVAVLTEQAKNAAMALVLAKDLAAADKKATISLLMSVITVLAALAIAWMKK
jgi:hypothetical protein